MPISLNSVSYTYTYAAGAGSQTQAIKELSLDITDGEFVGIMGRTGCGKSTLLQLIAGLLKPTSGTVLLDGEDINARKYDRQKLRRRVGVIFRSPEQQLFESTVERDVSFALKRFDMPKDEMEAAVKKALEAVGLDFDEIRNKSPLGFSDGERRRIAIAGVLAADPGILVLDEPLAGLDSTGQQALMKLLDKLNKNGMTVLVISHDADVLAEHAGRIIVLREGELFRDGKPLKVFSDYEGLTSNGISVPGTRVVAHMLTLPKRTVTYKQLLAGLITVCGGAKK